jgi:hypothetical protein
MNLMGFFAYPEGLNEGLFGGRSVPQLHSAVIGTSRKGSGINPAEGVYGFLVGICCLNLSNRAQIFTIVNKELLVSRSTDQQFSCGIVAKACHIVGVKF